MRLSEQTLKEVKVILNEYLENYTWFVADIYYSDEKWLRRYMGKTAYQIKRAILLQRKKSNPGLSQNFKVNL